MVCEGCKATDAARVRVFFIEQQMVKVCDRCADVPSVWLPDAYLGSGSGERRSEHLADPETGQAIPYSSKRQKAVIMRQLNVFEAGDAKRGNKNDNYSHKTRKHFII